MKSILLGAFCFLSIFTSWGQEQFTINGYIRDASNGESLIGATIYINEISNGTTTNTYGFYSIRLPQGKYNITYQYIGFTKIIKEVELNQNISLDINLTHSMEVLGEVVVTGEAIDKNVRSLEMSVAKMEIKSIEKLPAFVGEVDILKSIQLLPGVSTVGEGTSGFNVRGGSVGQNLILLDEAPVYQSSHLFGFFSVFNPDAVKDLKLYKGGIPAQYGGRLSSLLDVRMKEGNNKEYDVTGGIGTIFSRLAIEGPIKKDKASFIIAGRRSYGDLFAKAFTDVLKDGAALYFYDLTAKTNYIIDENNRIYLSGYLGRDVFRFDKFQGFDWGNRTATFRWNHVSRNNLFSNYSLFYSNYNYGFKIGKNEMDNYDWKSEISTYNFKPEYTWYAISKNKISFGGEAILYMFKPAKAVSVSDGVSSDISLEERKALEAAIYIGNEQQINEALTVQYGLRYSHFNYLGGTIFHYSDTIAGVEKRLLSTTQKDTWKTIKAYGNIEPRISFRYQLTNTSSLKASYNRMSQYINLISNTTASIPIDIWQPVTNNIKPQIGDQIALGYFKNLKENQYETSAEVYYKWNKNQVDYIDGADLFINRYLESQLLTGIGRAYGLELYAKKNTGRLTGWVSYTLGKTEMKVDGINYASDKIHHKGNWYPTRYDQRHNLKIVSLYDLTKKTSLSATFNFISGTPTTFPTDRITTAGYVIPYIKGSERNNFRIPNYHRLDLSITFNNIWRGKKGRKGEDYFVVSIYNVYGRKNPFSIYFSQGNERITDGKPITTSASQLSMIGTMIPALSYNFKF